MDKIDKNLNELLTMMEARIEILSALNDSYASLLLTIYDKLLSKKVLSKEDDTDIACASKALLENLQKCKLLTSHCEGSG